MKGGSNVTFGKNTKTTNFTKPKPLISKPKPKPLVFRPRFDDIEFVYTIPWYKKLLNFLGRCCNKLNPNHVFDLGQEDVNAKRNIEIAIAMHLIMLILVLFPYDKLFPKKHIKFEGVFVQLGSPKSIINPNGNNIPTMNHNNIPSNTDLEVPKSSPQIEEQEKSIFKKIVKSVKGIATSSTDGTIPVTNGEVKDNKKTTTNNQISDGLGTGMRDEYEDFTDINSVTSSGEMRGMNNDKKIISAHLLTCWMATQVSMRMPPDISVNVMLYFNQDGTIDHYKIIDKSYETPSKMLAYNVAVENAKKAIENCRNVKGLNEKNYSIWSTMNVTFKYSKIDF